MPLSIVCYCLQFLQMAQVMKISSSWKPVQSGWRLSTTSILSLYQRLVVKGELKFLMSFEPQPQRNEDKRSQRLVYQDVVDQDVMDGNLNAARPVKDDGTIEQQFETSVPIMALTAVKERHKNIKEIACYALVDTGADVSICTKDLAENMFRWSPEDSISISFLNEKAKRYQCMKKTLRLKYGENDTVNIPDVAFIDMKLPYSQCVPDKWLAKEYGYSVDHCHVAHEKRSVDMTLGAKDLRKFQVLEKCRWNNAAAFEYLVAAHPLGTIFWGLRAKKSIPQCN